MEQPPPKRLKQDSSIGLGKINGRYDSPEIITTVREQYNSEPLFRHAILPDFFNDEFYENVKGELFKELNEDDWCPKNNDLYTFIQSNDLKHSETVLFHF